MVLAKHSVRPFLKRKNGLDFCNFLRKGMSSKKLSIKREIVRKERLILKCGEVNSSEGIFLVLIDVFTFYCY